MGNLIALIASALVTTALLIWARRCVPARVALIAAYALTLALAMRFGARTYPGVWMGGAGWLNDLFNSSEIFWLGLAMVGIAAGGDLLSLPVARPLKRPLMTPRAAGWMRNVALAVASLIAFYGFWWAAALQRLPT